jgi:hypothetical protein
MVYKEVEVSSAHWVPSAIILSSPKIRGQSPQRKQQNIRQHIRRMNVQLNDRSQTPTQPFGPSVR